MANTNAPFGFKPWSGTGSPPTFETNVYKIASTDATAVFKGDVVMPVVSSATGYITRGVAGTVPMTGIFWGCKYHSTSQKRTVWSAYWPGADASGDVEAYVIDDPRMKLEVQSSDEGGSSAIAFSKVGQLINFYAGAGNTATGISGMTVDENTIGTTATLAFRIVGLIQAPPGANGTDITTEYNRVIVAWNNIWSGVDNITGIS